MNMTLRVEGIAKGDVKLVLHGQIMTECGK